MNRTTAILAVALLVGACGGATGDLGSVATPPLAIGHQIARRWAFGIDSV